jgi:hypothetical protein
MHSLGLSKFLLIGLKFAWGFIPIFLLIQILTKVFKNGNWVDAAVDPQTATQLENAILNRAREIRIAEGK